MPTTDRHGFELWEAGFTQSDTILNDLLLKLEVKVGASVLDRDLNEPAGGESDGDMYIVGSSPTGAWASFTAGDVVILRESTWYNFTPRRGATAMVEDESNIMVGWTGSAWTTVSVSQAYVDAAVAGLFDHKGGYNASTNTPDLDTSPSGVLKGDVYIVTADGDFFTEPVQIGDTLIADVDSASSLGDWTILESNAPKNNDAATTDPGTGDDDADGYSPGSRWTNVTDDTVWFCLDASTGAAVWQQVESGGGLSQSEVDARVVAVAGDSLNSGTFFSAVVDDDGVLIVDFGQNVFAANVIVTNNNVSSKCRGLFAIRATSSSAFCEIIAASNIEVATGILSGSTGSDATATVSTHTDNKMYIENRTGAACQFNITINGPQAVNYSVT